MIPPVLLPSSADPLIAIRVLFHAGSVHDPRGKEGLAALTVAMISEGGSKRLTYAELLDALYPLAAGIGARADKEVSILCGCVHRDNLYTYYDLFRQILIEPRFDPADFERLKSDQLNYLTRILRATDDENLGKEVLGAAMYEGHPYGRPTAGTVRGIRSIALDDVKAFYATHFSARHCELGLAGGYPVEFVDRVRGDLEGPKESRRRAVYLPAHRMPRGIEVTLVTKPARAWAISIGYPLDITRKDDDFYPLMLANSHLGEHRTFNGVLMKKMRSERGLNYGDYSYIENFIQEGGSTFPLANVLRRQQFFSIWIRPVAAGNAHFAIRQAMSELARLVRDGMSVEELETTRGFLLNYSRLWTQTAERRLGYRMDGSFYGGGSLVDEVHSRLPNLTLDQVNRAIRKHLQAENAYVAVVADEQGASTFVQALRSNAPSPVHYATETRPEVLEEDKRVAIYPLEVNSDRLWIHRAEELFE